MDLVILIIILVAVIFLFKSFRSFIYIVGIVDLALRVLSLVDANINWPVVNGFIQTYLPDSILAVINNNLTGIINSLAIWAYIICLGIFTYYIIRIFLKHK